MKIQENVIENKKVIQIYLNEEEKKDLEIQKKIKEMQSKNKVILFLSGNDGAKQALQEMVKMMKNNTITE